MDDTETCGRDARAARRECVKSCESEVLKPLGRESIAVRQPSSDVVPHSKKAKWCECSFSAQGYILLYPRMYKDYP